MPEHSRVAVCRVTSEADRQDALRILREIYEQEKRWVDDAELLLPLAELTDPKVSWFLARASSAEPAGVLRVGYDPPVLEEARKYEAKLSVQGLDLTRFVQENRIAEIGRFAVRRAFRRQLQVVLGLMGSAAEETIRREYTHFVTDVFEGEVNSPLHFHTRVLGFQPVLTHDTGELKCDRRRITLILNLRAAYSRLRVGRRRLYDGFTHGWDATMHAVASA